ncbi:MAG: phosphopentomutase [bacterium]
MAKPLRRAFLVVMDGVGVGNAPDASAFGDEGSDTLGNLSRAVGGLRLPTFQKLGLGNLAVIEGVPPVQSPLAAYGRLQEVSSGKDSINGHWELCGLPTELPFPTYSNAFPADVVELVRRISGRGVIGNEVASGTEIMARLGGEHVRSGDLILYTSADSVLQILAHEEVVPLDELYRICEDIHKALPPKHRVGRVIARPFVGEDGAFVRTANRRDYAVEPPADTVLDVLHRAGVPVHGVGKVDTLFAGRGYATATHTKDNRQGFDLTLEKINTMDRGLVFTNLLDFDTQWGHRNDIPGFHKGMEELDQWLPSWLEALKPGDLMLMTADHGNDPTTPSTDHSREHVPLLAILEGGVQGVDLGLRLGFMDAGATIAEFFDVPWAGAGKSFLSDLQR